jgi:hypothetical protein
MPTACHPRATLQIDFFRPGHCAGGRGMLRCSKSSCTTSYIAVSALRCPPPVTRALRFRSIFSAQATARGVGECFGARNPHVPERCQRALPYLRGKVGWARLFFRVGPRRALLQRALPRFSCRRPLCRPTGRARDWGHRRTPVGPRRALLQRASPRFSCRRPLCRPNGRARDWGHRRTPVGPQRALLQRALPRFSCRRPLCRPTGRARDWGHRRTPVGPRRALLQRALPRFSCRRPLCRPTGRARFLGCPSAARRPLRMRRKRLRSNSTGVSIATNKKGPGRGRNPGP